jgi:DNA repair protein RadC
MIFKCSENPGVYRVASETLTESEILEAARVILDAQYASGFTFNNPTAVGNFLKHAIGKQDREVFGVLFLDTQHHKIAYEELFQGTIDAAAVYPREIVRRALMLNASALVLAHNHPSGDSDPSVADIVLTKKIIDACKTVDLRVLDHIVVGKVPYSMAENGHCSFN